MKKSHKHEIGDIVKFSYFDGGTYVGKVIEQTYMGALIGEPHYNLPQYKIQVPRPNNPTPLFYTVSDNYFKEVNGEKVMQEYKSQLKTISKSKTKELKKSSHCHYSGLPSPSAYAPKKSELDQAIERQKDFIRGNVTI